MEMSENRSRLGLIWQALGMGRAGSTNTVFVFITVHLKSFRLRVAPAAKGSRVLNRAARILGLIQRQFLPSAHERVCVNCREQLLLDGGTSVHGRREP